MLNVLEYLVEGIAEVQSDGTFKVRVGGEVFHFAGFSVSDGSRVRVSWATLGLGGMPFTVQKAEILPIGLNTSDGHSPINS